MDVYYDENCDPSIVLGLSVAVIGYGSQGRAHALNLKDAGASVVVGLPADSDQSSIAVADGFSPVGVSEAVAGAGLVVVMLPDERHGEIYKADIEPSISQGAGLAFAHGFSVHYGQIVPREDLSVFMVAPKASGAVFRDTYVSGGGVPGIVAFNEKEPSASVKSLAYSYASAIGVGRAGFVESTFKSEVEASLFGGQVLHGGVVELLKMAFESMSEAGIAPEVAYLETLHGLKDVADSLYLGGVAGLNQSLTNNAEYGEYLAGQEIVGDESRAAMRAAVKRIKFGEYAMKFIAESGAGYPSMSARRVDNAEHDLEVTGEELRGLIR